MHMEFFRITMPQLADYLTNTITNAHGQGPLVPVVDRTGLEGPWNIVVERVYEDAAAGPPDAPITPIPITPMLVLDELSRGLTKSGLKLEKTTAPIEMLVVDSADKIPTEN
jgi:uncharacterized protein (TIGR03435 family)